MDSKNNQVCVLLLFLRFVMVQAPVLEKSSSPMVLREGRWWEALQNR